MEVWKIMFLSFHGWCVGSMLIFQGVWFTWKWTAQRGGSVAFWFHHHFQMKNCSFRGKSSPENSPISWKFRVGRWFMCHFLLKKPPFLRFQPWSVFQGSIWVFPKIGVPSKHPKRIIFCRENQWLLGTTILGNTHILSTDPSKTQLTSTHHNAHLRLGRHHGIVLSCWRHRQLSTATSGNGKLKDFLMFF